MPTRKTTKSTNSYNPQSMSAFNSLQGPMANTLQSYINNPMGAVSPMYDVSGQLAQRNAMLLGQSGMSNLMNNQAASGFSGQNMPAYMASQMAAQQRATSGMQGNAFLQNQLAKNQSALGVQQFGLSQAGMFRPLQTGGTQTQSTGGIGAWATPIAGMALAGMTGGASAGAGGLLGMLNNSNAAGNAFGGHVFGPGGYFGGGGGQP